MNFFAIQVLTGHEDMFIQFFSKTRPETSVHHIKKQMKSRKLGKPVTLVNSLFPGYLFFQYDGDRPSPELVRAIRRTKYFLRILPSTDKIKPLSERDAEILRKLLAFGGEIGPSLVTFDENNLIKVIRGPMMGLEGRIIKVDRRKKRAKVQLDMNDSPITFDLSFELLETVKEPQG